MRHEEKTTSMDLKEFWCEGVEWIKLDENTVQRLALLKAVMNLCPL
jgi:hypothetical protein